MNLGYLAVVASAMCSGKLVAGLRRWRRAVGEDGDAGGEIILGAPLVIDKSNVDSLDF